MSTSQQPDPISSRKPKVVKKTGRRYRETRTLKGSKCWITAPGNTELLKKAVVNLLLVGEMNGRSDLAIEGVAAVAVPETRQVYLWPVDKEDPLGYEVSRVGSFLRVNLGPLLEDASMALPVRHKERFALSIVLKEETPDDVPNALCLDLNTPEEVQVKPLKSKSKSNETQPSGGEASAD